MLRRAVTVLPATEWSLPFDGAPPEPIQPVVAQVIGLIRSLVSGAPRASMAVPDRPRVVTIFGDRGTGKSTVLQFALRGLSQIEDCLVLPVIDPEGFAIGDSLGGWVLAHLQNELSAAEKGFALTEGTSLGALLQDVARTQAVHSSAFLPGLEKRGLTFEDFGRDAVKVPIRGVGLGAAWARLLEGVAQATGKPNLQLVVAIDDADLVPELLPTIVSSAQLLGSSARTAIVFAASESTLRQSLEMSLIAGHGTAADDALRHGILTANDVHSLVGRRLVKSFPRSLRVHLADLGLDERLNFRPLGSSVSMIDLMQRLSIKAFGFGHLSDLFLIRRGSGASLGPSGYAHVLSNNARDLRQLYEALEQIQPEEDNAGAQALEVILVHGTESVEYDLSSSARGQWTVRGAKPRAALSFDLTELHFGKETGSALPIYRPLEEPTEDSLPARTLFARLVRVHYSYRAGENATLDAPEDEAAEQRGTTLRLPIQFSYLTFLAWECIQRNDEDESLLDSDGTLSSLLLPGGLNWQKQVADVQARESWPYWSVPEWESFSDYFIFSASWQCLHAVVSEYTVTPGHSELVEFLLLAHVRAVVSTQQYRRVPDDIADLNVGELSQIVAPETWPTERAKRLADIQADLTNVLQYARKTRSQRNVDFVAWFDGLFPLLASRLFTTPDFGASLLALWEAEVPESQRARAAATVGAIVAEHLEDPLADVDLELLSRIDPERASGLRNVREQLARERVNIRSGALHELENRDVSRDLLDAITRSGATREVLVALVAAGVPAQLMAQIAELFPPHPQPGDDDGLSATTLQ
jgi:hypothetical protein